MSVNRITPWTAGATVALLLVALVVQPLWAESSQCGDCQVAWYNTAMSCNSGFSTPCSQYCPANTQYKMYMLSQCARSYAYNRCYDLCQLENPPQTSDCSSATCSESTCDNEFTQDGSLCGGSCNNCDAAGNSCNQLQVNPPPPPESLTPCFTYCGCGNP